MHINFTGRLYCMSLIICGTAYPFVEQGTHYHAYIDIVYTAQGKHPYVLFAHARYPR